jgi:hypothetical protein
MEYKLEWDFLSPELYHYFMCGLSVCLVRYNWTYTDVMARNPKSVLKISSSTFNSWSRTGKRNRSGNRIQNIQLQTVKLIHPTFARRILLRKQHKTLLVNPRSLQHPRLIDLIATLLILVIPITITIGINSSGITSVIRLRQTRKDLMSSPLGQAPDTHFLRLCHKRLARLRAWESGAGKWVCACAQGCEDAVELVEDV